MVELHQVRYLPYQGAGFDRLAGRVIGHPHYRDGIMVWVSHPVAFDIRDSVLTTTSGSEYRIKSWGDDPESVIDRIRKDVKCKDF